MKGKDVKEMVRKIFDSHIADDGEYYFESQGSKSVVFFKTTEIPQEWQINMREK